MDGKKPRHDAEDARNLYSLILRVAGVGGRSPNGMMRSSIGRTLQGACALVALACAIGVFVWVTGLAFGFFPAYGSPDSSFKDSALVRLAFLHALLGIPLAVLPWVAGSGLVAFFLRRTQPSFPAIVLPGFIAGMVVAALLVSIVLLIPFGWGIAAVVWCLFVWPLASRRTLFFREFRDLATLVLKLTPYAVLLGTWFGVIHHGPTETLTAHPHTDASYYAGAIRALLANPTNPINYGFEGETLYHFNMLFPGMGAVVAKFAEIDTFLFISAAGGTAFLVNTGIALNAALSSTESHTGRDTALAKTGLLTSVLICTMYPTWIVASPPMIYLTALTISTCFMVARGVSGGGWILIAVLGALIGTILSKIVAAIFLVPLALSSSIGYLRQAPRSWQFLLVAIVGLAGSYGAYMLIRFMPYMIHWQDIGPLSWRWYKLGYDGLLPIVLRDISSVILLIVALRLGRRDFAMLACAVGILAGLLFEFAFFASLLSAGLGLVLLLRMRGQLCGRLGSITVGALVMALPQAVFSDPAGGVVGLIWVLCVGGAFLVANSGQGASVPRIAPPSFSAKASVYARLIVLGSLCISLLAVGNHGIALKTGYWFPTSANSGLTPDVRDIWHEIRKRVPADGLVFTAEINLKPTLTTGWNTYLLHGERQVYFGQFVQTAAARTEVSLLNKRLEANQAVVEGQVLPGDVKTTKRYKSYYLVAPVSVHPSEGWSAIYRNPTYTLFKWVG